MVTAWSQAPVDMNVFLQVKACKIVENVTGKVAHRRFRFQLKNKTFILPTKNSLYMQLNERHKYLGLDETWN